MNVILEILFRLILWLLLPPLLPGIINRVKAWVAGRRGPPVLQLYFDLAKLWRKGVVLSILSTSTITGRAFTVPSAMAKSALLAMTRSLAVEWGPKGIRLVAIAPGAFPTPGATGQLRPDGRDQGWASRNPLGRSGEHRELADLAAFLISDGAAYINGEMVVVDGGAHLRSSGAEDLLQWTEAQWEQHRASRSRS